MIASETFDPSNKPWEFDITTSKTSMHQLLKMKITKHLLNI